VAISDRVLALGEEFSDYILVDHARHSIVIYFETEYYDILCEEYLRHGYRLRHVTRFEDKDSVTCVFASDV
jgi:hypothetical protein